MGTSTTIGDPGTITTRDHSTAPADRLTRDQNRHIFKPTSNLGIAIGSAPAAAEHITFVATSAGFVRGFHATLNTALSSGTVTFDMKINGSSILGAVISFSSSDAAKAIKNATISSAAYNAGDIVSFVLAVSSPVSAAGPACWASCDEYAE